MADLVSKSEKRIRSLFKDNDARTDASSRMALAYLLLYQAGENTDDPVAEYALLHECRDVAVLAGDTPRALQAEVRLRESFTLDFTAMLFDLRTLEPLAKTPDTATTLATLLSLGADEALAVTDYDHAVRFHSHAEDLLPLIKDAALKARLKAEIPRVQALRHDYLAALAAQKTLAANPDDVDANFVTGEFALLVGDFGRSLPLLAKGRDAALGSLASLELAPPKDAVAQAQLGDSWFERAAKEPSVYLKPRMEERAAYWYRLALPGLKGLAKVQAESQLKVLKLAMTAESKYAPMKFDPASQTSGGENVADSARWARAIDLIPLINLEQDKLTPGWKFENGTLFSDKTQGDKIQLPYTPPAEYDSKIEFTTSGGCSLNHYGVYGGKAFSFIMGSQANKFCAIEMIDGHSAGDAANPTSKTFKVAPDVRHVSIVQVRHDGVRAWLDGQLMGEIDPISARARIAESEN